MGGEVLESVYDEIERLEQENETLKSENRKTQREAKQQTDRLVALLKTQGVTDEQIQNALAGTV